MKIKIEKCLEMIDLKVVASIGTSLLMSDIIKGEVMELLNNTIPELLTEFFQHKSDACTLECSEQEQMEIEFKEFVQNKLKECI